MNIDKKKLITLVIVLSFVGTTYANKDIVSGISQPLTNARNDVNTPKANSTVWYSGCTGTLISPDLVVTAGHCNSHGQNIGHNSGLTCSNSDPEVSGRWYPIEERKQIRVGNNSSRPLFTTTAIEYTIPGCADIFLVRLANPVPSSIAKPAKVLVSLGGLSGAKNATILRGKPLNIAGWGLGADDRTPTIRRIASTSFHSLGTDRSLGKVLTQSTAGSLVRSGDSGGPLYWDTRTGERYLVAVTQGSSGDKNRFTPTFRNSLYFQYMDRNGLITAEGDLPSVGEWFLSVAPEAVHCEKALNAPQGMLPLLSYYSPTRKDNLITSSPEYAGCTGTVRSPDYKFTKVEGYLFNPSLPQPKGTIKLQSWYSPSRKDNFTTSEPEWIHWGGDGKKRSPDYNLSRLEGYIYDPAKNQPQGTKPLYRWYSRSRVDNHTTATFERQGRQGAGLQPDYGRPKLLGYIRSTL